MDYLLVLAIILASATAAIAKSKGYEPWGMFALAGILSFISLGILGVVMLIIFAFMPHRKRPCPHCGQRIDHTTNTCPFCHKSVTPLTPTTQP